MGVTNFEIKLLNGIIDTYRPKIVLDFGSQNDYSTNELKPPFMSGWWLKRNIDYTSIDLAGDNNSLKLNWSYPLEIFRKFNLVIDAGSSEHSVQSKGYTITPFHEGYINSVYPNVKVTDEEIELGYYNCWLNKHNLLKQDGIMLSVNPLTDNWEGHGYSYINEDFYKRIAEFSDYEILQLGTHAAMGNTKDGWNVYCVMQKKSEVFPSFYEFNKFPIFKK